MARHHLVDESGNLDAAQRVHHDFPGLDDRVHPNRVEHEDKEATYLRGTPSGSRRAAAKQAHRSRCRCQLRSAGMGGGRGCGVGRAHRRRRSTLALDPHVCWLRLVPPRVHPTEHVQVRAAPTAAPQRRPVAVAEPSPPQSPREFRPPGREHSHASAYPVRSRGRCRWRGRGGAPVGWWRARARARPCSKRSPAA